MGEFDGLVAVVTGGAGGIGTATTALLRQRGASVVSLDRVEHQDPAAVAALTTGNGGSRSEACHA